MRRCIIIAPMTPRPISQSSSWVFVVGGVLTLERGLSPPIWVHLAIWLPLTLIGSLLLLPRVKGALVALQWALYMHGFDPARAPDPSVDPR